MSEPPKLGGFSQQAPALWLDEMAFLSVPRLSGLMSLAPNLGGHRTSVRVLSVLRRSGLMSLAQKLDEQSHRTS